MLTEDGCTEGRECEVGEVMHVVQCDAELGRG